MRIVFAAILALLLPVSSASAAGAVVFFTTWSGLLDPAAELVVRTAATAAKVEGGTIQVIGYADTTGSATANDLLSHLRAQLVRDELVADGIQPDKIQVSWKGATGFTDAPNESRRVVIRFGQ